MRSTFHDPEGWCMKTPLSVVMHRPKLLPRESRDRNPWGISDVSRQCCIRCACLMVCGAWNAEEYVLDQF